MSCFCPGLCQGAAWARTNLRARGCRGSPGRQVGQGRGQVETAGFNQESRSLGTSVMVRRVQDQAIKSVHGLGSKGSMAGHSCGSTGNKYHNITAQMEVKRLKWDPWVEVWSFVRLSRANETISASMMLRGSVKKPCLLKCF